MTGKRTQGKYSKSRLAQNSTCGYEALTKSLVLNMLKYVNCKTYTRFQRYTQKKGKIAH